MKSNTCTCQPISIRLNAQVYNTVIGSKDFLGKMNGFSTEEEVPKSTINQICCLLDDDERCRRPAGNASYNKRIQKTLTQRRLKLRVDSQVSYVWY
ncbi:SAP30L [Cordylochernes scorpioides]|uniref:SAP30L n=1 Tax=Cordylochernes scorpioides TaxID=51811 RepID=A0ABY6LTS5_9ARAC|nr:SAP30L [Cordylochernes scorpioides]